MAVPYDDLKTAVKRSIKPLSGLVYVWTKLAPMRALILAATLQLVFSLACITYLSRSFNFGKRVIALHISIVLLLTMIAVLVSGSSLVIRPVRQWRLTKFVFAFVGATCSSALALLYFSDYVANRLWGNNVNYELVSQYIVGNGMFRRELWILPASVYLALAATLLAIYTIYAFLSAALVRGLEELFLPGGELSMFQNRRRGLISGASISTVLVALVLIGFSSTEPSSSYRARVQMREPIVSLFSNADSLNDFVSYSSRARLEAEERQIRARYPISQQFEPKNVAIIMVDSLRADHMAVYGYERTTTPFLSSLLKTSRLQRVETALSNYADTKCGVMATLSSKLLKKQIPQMFKLPDLLQAQGYNLHFVLAGNHYWYNLRNSYGANPTSYFDGTGSAKYDWNDDRVIFEGLDQVADFSGVPAFFYFHLMSTHSIGIRQPQYSRYEPASNWVGLGNSESDSIAAINYYDNGVVQADAIIEGIFARLKQKGYLDNMVAVILADHGEALGQADHSSYGHVNYLYQECIRIPMLIYDDSPREYANLQYATQIDVAPTILNRLGLAIPSSWQGRSLFSSAPGQYSFHQGRIDPPSYAVIYRSETGIYKYLKHASSGEELYELGSDPRERHNLIGIVDPAIVEHLRGKLTESLMDQ